jgi:acyl-ACP thioesterase
MGVFSLSIFQTKNHVHYYEINNHRQATPVTVLNYFEEAAVRQSEECGCGVGKLIGRGLIWVLTNWSMQMVRYPGWMEEVLAETRVCRFERFYAFRQFYIRDKNNNLLGSADTQWIFYDLNRNRPVRVPPEIIEAFGVDPGLTAVCNFPVIGTAASYEHRMEFGVRISDIDMNRHVNNTRYVEWMLEAVPIHVHREYFPAAIEIAYKKETMYGAQVVSEINQKSHNYECMEFLHKITDKATGAELARAATLWKKAV